MHVEACPGATDAPDRPALKAPLGQSEICQVSELHVRGVAFKDHHRKTGPFEQRRIVGERKKLLSRGILMGFQQEAETEALRCLNRTQASAVRSRNDKSV